MDLMIRQVHLSFLGDTMKVDLKDGFLSDTFNTCVGCSMAVYPGERVYLKPSWGYPTSGHPSYGRQEVICETCAEAVRAVTHDVYCKTCINPNVKSEHVWECPTRKVGE